jgi:hypothetical protein
MSGSMVFAVEGPVWSTAHLGEAWDDPVQRKSRGPVSFVPAEIANVNQGNFGEEPIDLHRAGRHEREVKVRTVFIHALPVRR